MNIGWELELPFRTIHAKTIAKRGITFEGPIVFNSVEWENPVYIIRLQFAVDNYRSKVKEFRNKFESSKNK